MATLAELEAATAAERSVWIAARRAARSAPTDFGKLSRQWDDDTRNRANGRDTGVVLHIRTPWSADVVECVHTRRLHREATCTTCGIYVLRMRMDSTMCATCEDASCDDLVGEDEGDIPMFGRDDLAALNARNAAVMARKEVIR